VEYSIAPAARTFPTKAVLTSLPFIVKLIEFVDCQVLAAPFCVAIAAMQAPPEPTVRVIKDTVIRYIPLWLAGAV
jgi:hypothetical protein